MTNRLSRPRRSRAATAVGVALMLGGGSALLIAAPAQAAESSFATKCIPPKIANLPDINGTTKADITAPATAKVGDTIDVTWKTVQAASQNPGVADLPANSVLPTGKVTIGGAQTGSLDVAGTRTNPAIPKNSPMVLSDMKGKLKLTAAGDVTLSPGAYNINANYIMSTDTACAPTGTVPVAVTIKVTGGGTGGTTTSGGTTSGGTTTSGTTGGTTTSGGTTSGGTTSGGTTGGTTTGGTTSGGTTGGGGEPNGTEHKGTPVSVTFDCGSFGKPTGQVAIDATKSSAGYNLSVRFIGSVMKTPAPLPKGFITATMAVKVAGADSGTVQVKAPPNTKAFAQNDPVTLDPLTGVYSPGRTGSVTLHPGVLAVQLAQGGTPVATCTPTKAVDASLTLDIKEKGSDSGGTNGSAANSATTTSGGLAQTGADNNGSLRALGLIAGTVLLLGGAVFTFTPWRKLRH
ncbi:hypothetical protein [Streptomyces sp. RKAG337]|uniref:hypothetical protein n=1 Tax=Streptomyces sp. RKAG337 TaxID=2893404 RepID=UPI00203450A6|nr:hypothetical protein [Streptomyces sp. RKAG337]MCM2428085.1 hypothetical protein [Streptomyces sp. RKAG337]